MLTREQIEAKFLVIAQLLNFDITAWEPLSSVRTFNAIVAQAMSNETQTTTLMARSVLLDFAANTDGTINRVDFYSGTTLIATSASTALADST